jgi:replication factor A1
MTTNTMQTIRELRDGDKQVSVEGDITAMADARDVSLRTGGSSRVVDATLDDGSASINLTLWNEQIDKVRKGARVRVVNAYVNTYKGQRQLNVGRYGSIELV